MTDTLELERPETAGALTETVELVDYARDAYLDYAMSVVLGRALPLLTDGQKPVQRRILYSMHRLGLSHPGGSGPKPVKCARVVGDVLGRYHPHGDTAAYDALVRMAQPFSLRYPLIDGQGNFGTLDGDGAAAMRYTEARLTPIAELLLGEIDQGTVGFVPNYDGSTQEPEKLPARLPMLLLNGAEGIAVGMATNILSHNLVEVANACELLIRNPEASLSAVLDVLPGPDFPCGGQLTAPREDIVKAYTTGRGSLRVRARWVVEPLAKNQWQIAIYELPPGVSAALVQQEIDKLANPQVKEGKKTLTAEQIETRDKVLAVVAHISDESDKKNPVRIVIEPARKVTPEQVMQVLLAHTSLEGNASLNLTTIGEDGIPQQKGLLQVLQEWIAFRYETMTRRTQHRLRQVRDRMHILEGRLTVFAHLDEVIRVIREASDAKAELMSRFGLSEVQATNILEIQLRQLASLEKLKLETEHKALAKEAAELQLLLDDRNAMREQMLVEVAADRKRYGDARRTLIEAAERVTTATVTVAAPSSPVTLIVSKQGWVRARAGHKADLSTLTWKTGDELLTTLEARTSDTVAVFDATGRVYNVAASAFPTGRGDGVPLSSLVECGANLPEQVIVLDGAMNYLLTHDAGLGFVCPGEKLKASKKAGKEVWTTEPGEKLGLLPPVAIKADAEAGEVAVAASNGKLLVFPLDELKVTGGGKGMQLIGLTGKERVVAAFASATPLEGLKVEVENGDEHLLFAAALEKHRGRRARTGSALLGKAVAMRITAATPPAELAQA